MESDRPNRFSEASQALLGWWFTCAASPLASSLSPSFSSSSSPQCFSILCSAQMEHLSHDRQHVPGQPALERPPCEGAIWQAESELWNHPTNTDDCRISSVSLSLFSCFVSPCCVISDVLKVTICGSWCYFGVQNVLRGIFPPYASWGGVIGRQQCGAPGGPFPRGLDPVTPMRAKGREEKGNLLSCLISHRSAAEF